MELMLPESKRLLVAFSGGADSTALLNRLWELRGEAGLELVAAAHFNHGLRREADSDEEHVRAFCRERGITCYFGRADVAEEAGMAGRGVEETARVLRYDFLAMAAGQAGAGAICTAHNANDNLETVLLNLVRGTGLAGLRGIPRSRGNVFRPILHVPREEILEYLREKGIGYVEDASNADTSYRRNRMRHEVVPVLKDLNPRIEHAVTQATRLLREDEDFFDTMTSDAMAHAVNTPEGVSYDVAALAELHPAVAVRVCRAMCQAVGFPAVQYEHLNAMLGLVRGDSPSARVSLPRGIAARRQYDRLVVGPDVLLRDSPDFGLECSPVPAEADGDAQGDPQVFYINSDTIAGDIVVRSRQPGDEISLVGRSGTRTIKKLFIDEKVPRHLRDAIPVIADDAGVIAVSGFGIDRSRVPRPGCPLLKLTVRSPEL